VAEHLSVEERVNRLDLPFNSRGIDPYGISKDYLVGVGKVLEFLYRRYFRVRVHDIDHVPARGRAMLVGNHSGGVAIDGAMLITSCLLDMEPPRLLQGMAEKFINRFPFASMLASRTGQFTGLPEHAKRILEDDRLLMVFPEGARGTAKLYKERHSLVDFGTGFMRLALQTKTPIIPIAVLGGGEAFPTFMNSYALGRLAGVPYVPITSYLLPIPRPAQMDIYYGSPMVFEGTGSEEDEVIQRYVDEVKAVIAGLIERNKTSRLSLLGSGDR
jgi:1-acyl-sn-glycerol-3-phosphate acyltransferase